MNFGSCHDKYTNNMENIKGEPIFEKNFCCVSLKNKMPFRKTCFKVIFLFYI